MSKGFKIVMAFFVLLIGGFFVAFWLDEGEKKSSDTVPQNMTASQEQVADKRLDDLATAAYENEQHQKMKQVNPPVYPKLSLQQTKDFISRVEKVRANDGSVADTTTDRARQNRAYNDLQDEAVQIYGTNKLANKYRDCVAMIDYAKLAFDLRFDRSFDAERRKDLMKTHEGSYQDAKNGCLEAVR